MSDYYYIYMVECKDARGRISYYTGYTNNPERRINEHKNGRGARYLKGREFVDFLIHTERFKSRAKAMKCEREVKKMPHAAKAYLFEGRRILDGDKKLSWEEIFKIIYELEGSE
jgi:putative endonuclease